MTRLIRIAILLWPLLLIAAPVTLAQSDDLRLESSAGYTFGQAMQFTLDVSNAAGLGELTAVTLYFRPLTETTVYAVSVPLPPEPGDVFRVTQPVDLTEVQLAPYSTVEYWWELESAGGTISVPKRTVIYEDDQFPWQRTGNNGVTAHWVGQGPFFGQQILDVALETLPRLAEVIPITEIEPFDIYAYPSAADMRAALRLSGISDIEEPHPELGVVLITAVNPQSAAADLRQAVPYGLTHLLLYRVTGDDYGSLPPWFSEGLALAMQAEPDPRFAQALQTAVVTGTTIPFEQLCAAFPPEPDRALLAAAQSDSLLRYLRDRYGATAVRDMTAAYAEGVSCNVGIEQALQRPLTTLEQEWLASLQPQSPAERFLGRYGLWILLIGFSFGITMFLTWRARREAGDRE